MESSLTFPDQRFADISRYCDKYGRQYSDTSASIDRGALAEAAQLRAI